MTHLAAHGNPSAINGNTRALPFQRFQLFLLEEILEAAFRVAAVLANDAERGAIPRFRNQPIEVRRVVGHKPDARGIRRTIFGEPDDGLHKRNGLNRRPAGSASDAARRTVCADEAVGMQFFALAAAFNFETQTTFIRRNPEKTGVKRERSSSLLSLTRESGNQPRTLDNQVRLLEGNLRGTAVGEKFKAADFVDDAVLGHRRHLCAEMIRNNQSAGRRLQPWFGFQYANRAPAAGYAGGGKESGCGSSDNNNLS